MIATYLREWYVGKQAQRFGGAPAASVASKPKLIIPDIVFEDEDIRPATYWRVNQRVRHATFGIGTIKVWKPG